MFPSPLCTFEVMSEANNNLFSFSLQPWHPHNLICSMLGEETLLDTPATATQSNAFGHHSC